TMTRREFGRLAAFAPLIPAAGRAAAKRIPIALQLYSVRKDCARDMAGTIAAVAKMGYEAVEFAGYYEHSAKDLKKILDSNNIRCCGTHTAISTLLGDELPKTIEFNRIIGNKNLIVPSLDHEKYLGSKDAIIKTAHLFSEISAKVKPHGMRVGYHNHSFEFKPMDGEIPFNLFFENAGKDVCIQVDFGNALAGGGDPVSVVRRFPGQSISVHLKDWKAGEKHTLFGQGSVNWKEVFHVCETVGGTQWYIIEYESEEFPPLESVKKCLDAFRAMKK
ncbi:MAG: sugar phosphate isomerase/epimerase, partial [Bryobacteraceae bacterium]